MRILNIITLGNMSGGAEVAVSNLKTGLSDWGHDVKVLSSDLRKDGEKFSDFEFKSISSSSPFKMFLHVFNPYSYLKLKKILKETNPDIVHLHTMWHVSPSVLFLLRKYPTVMTLHGPESFLKSFIDSTLPSSDFVKDKKGNIKLSLTGKFHYFYFMIIMRSVYKLGIKNIDLFIAPSDFIKSQTKNEVGKTKRIYNSIKLLNYSKPVASNSILYVGRLAEEKGVEYLISAMPQILKKAPSAKLTIIGDGENRSNLEDLVKVLRLNKSIKFLGWVKNDQLEKYYKKTQIVVIPSICPEIFSLVGLEAMSVGRPVIASRVGGIPEWLEDGKNGYLVEKANKDQIADAAIRILSNNSLFEKISINARKTAEKFTLEKYVGEVESAYKSILSK